MFFNVSADRPQEGTHDPKEGTAYDGEILNMEQEFRKILKFFSLEKSKCVLCKHVLGFSWIISSEESQLPYSENTQHPIKEKGADMSR